MFVSNRSKLCWVVLHGTDIDVSLYHRLQTGSVPHPTLSCENERPLFSEVYRAMCEVGPVVPSRSSEWVPVHLYCITRFNVYQPTYVLTHSVEQSPSEANRFSSSQIPRILCNTKIHYRIHRCLPPVPILSQINPVHSPIPLPGRTILILSSHLRLDLSSGLPHQNSVYASPLHHTC